MTKVIDAPLFAKMIISGANNLSNNRELVDSLNVFPVPDGDTGTNMSLTFISAARAIEGCDFNSVTEVAERMGYSSIHAFSNAFSAREGVSPSVYADKRKKK